MLIRYHPSEKQKATKLIVSKDYPKIATVSQTDLPIDRVVKVIKLKPNPDYPKHTPKGGNGCQTEEWKAGNVRQASYRSNNYEVRDG